MAFFSKIAARMMQPKVGAAEYSFHVIGKHPAWDDHMPDIGVDRPEVLDFKQRFYVEALAGNINSGAWKHLPEPELLPAFNHRFVYWHADAVLHGAIWASSDGKGRRLFPLIAMVFARGLDPQATSKASAVILDAFHLAVERTPAADGLKTAVNEANAALAAAASQMPSMEQLIPFLTGIHVADLLRQTQDSHQRARLIYALQRSLQYTKANISNRSCDFSELVRLPSGDLSSSAEYADTLVAWPGLCLSNIGRSVPLLTVVYHGAPESQFTDLIIGAIKPASIFPLRASREKIPLCTEIPFQLDAAFVRACDAYLAACIQAGSAPAPALPTV